MSALRSRLLCLSPLVLALVGCGEDEDSCTSIDCKSAAAEAAGGSSTVAGVISNDGGRQGLLELGPELASGAGGTDSEVCREVVFSSEANPVNVHILVDRSVSMLRPANPLDDPDDPNTVTRWDAITGGLAAFLASDSIAGAQVGLQFFGLQSTDEFDCNVENYRTPAVALAPIESNRQALLSTLAETLPGTLTPTAPAVEGALSYALQIAQSPEGQDRPTVMILATDGLPSQCGPKDDDGNNIISFAAINESLQAYSEPPLDANGEPTVPPILTYVVGTSELGANASVMAEAGGGQAFLIGATQTSSFEADFLDALLTVVLKPLDCEIPVPQRAPDTNEVLDFDKIRVQYRGAATGRTREFPRTDAASTCGTGQAWYYDNADAPEKILFCPRACDALGAGDLKLELGCSPQLFLL